MIPETVSHYHIVKRLGQGGMGEVYLAEDAKLGRKVAIKFLSRTLVEDDHAKRRLIREAKAAAILDHPNICAVHDVGEEGSGTYIVMQYAEGETLSNRIQRGPLDLEEILDLATQIVDSLCEAHSHGIIHRDIKPENIIITPQGKAKVLDFGLAKLVRDKDSPEFQSELTKADTIIGTVPYMSPEQALGEELDGRTDIFSFGVMLYEMITGIQPFKTNSAVATISAILTKEPPPLSDHREKAPPELERIVSKSLCKKREDRYQTARELLNDLKYRKQQLLLDKLIKRNRTSSYFLWGAAGGAVIAGVASLISAFLGTSLLWKHHVTYMFFRVIFEGAVGGIFIGGFAYLAYAIVFNIYDPKLTRRKLIVAEMIAGCLAATIIASTIFFLVIGKFGFPIAMSAIIGYWTVPALGGVAMGFSLNVQSSQAEPEALLNVIIRSTVAFSLVAVSSTGLIHFLRLELFSPEYLKQYELMDLVSDVMRCAIGSIGLAAFHWWLKWHEGL
jgi:hypothetical protein